MGFASRDAREQFIARHYRYLGGEEIYALLPCRPYLTMTRSYKTYGAGKASPMALGRRIGAAGNAVVYQWESRKHRFP